ncbi:serine/threonine-protein kinase [Lignipirellula cremea]|uniref:Serine/threonine-protein kinase PknB n=1 Tax=Lignipirellula cremea TaxID=2528010 RepID=A0A518DN32_9BACT|nr:serine/threonine-protein kinase [Lignipirellula cremea]QDU93248.1 Serine/threonine-protein kinase PknB [Lignipirellula cremea]
MQIGCPYCRHEIRIKGSTRPGRYFPTCSQCQRRFAVTVPELRLIVEALDEHGEPIPAPLDPQATQQMSLAGPSPASAFDQPTAGASQLLEARTAGDAINPTQASLPQGSEPTSLGHTVVAGTAGATDSGSFLLQNQDTLDSRAIGQGEAAGPTGAGPSMPERLGGYRLQKELGHGGMGAVYLARQTSLDRDVALKLIQPRLARDPVYLSRFTREAYAAAQLNHHNVVQVYDLGSAGGVHFFSMEYVEGRSLSELLGEKGRLSPREAAGYIVQAARGLLCAHDHGLVHRDVKPANLMLNQQGVVKVADLGLVKLRDVDDLQRSPGDNASIRDALAADATRTNIAMGTPAYMAPEQAGDSSGVDHRADIYALGCTFYSLLTGRPPFEGKTALEVITRHRSEPVVRPEMLVEGISPELSEITLGMVEKEPARRPQDLGQVIAALEALLGGDQETLDLKASEQIEQTAHAFANASTGRLAGWLALAGAGGSLLLSVVFALLGWYAVAAAALLAPLAAVASNILIVSWAENSHLMRRIRDLLFRSRWFDYCYAAVSAVAVTGLLFLLGLLLPTLLFVSLGAGVGIAWYAWMQRPTASRRQEAVRQLENVIRNLRIAGRSEEAVQRLTARSSGDDWEELFERLFGYEAMLVAREQRQAEEPNRRLVRYAAWRDPLVRRIDARIEELQRQAEHRHLQKIEIARLRAEGLSAKEARQRAADSADNMVDQASALHAVRLKPPADRRREIKAMLAQTRKEGEQHRRSLASRARRLVGLFCGPTVRFAVAAFCLAMFVLWAQQNDLWSGARLPSTLSLPSFRQEAGEQGKQLLEQFQSAGERQPLRFLPEPLATLFSGLGPLAAGVLLLLSLSGRGWKTSIGACVAAAICLWAFAWRL